MAFGRGQAHLILCCHRELLVQLAREFVGVSAVPPLDELCLGDALLPVGVDLFELLLRKGGWGCVVKKKAYEKGGAGMGWEDEGGMH